MPARSSFVVVVFLVAAFLGVVSATDADTPFNLRGAVSAVDGHGKGINHGHRSLQDTDVPKPFECEYKLDFLIPDHQSEAFTEPELKAVRQKVKNKLNHDTRILDGFDIHATAITEQRTDGTITSVSDGGRRLMLQGHALQLFLNSIGECRFCDDEDADDDGAANSRRNLLVDQVASNRIAKRIYLSLGRSDPLFEGITYLSIYGECMGTVVDGYYVPADDPSIP